MVGNTSLEGKPRRSTGFLVTPLITPLLQTFALIHVSEPPKRIQRPASRASRHPVQGRATGKARHCRTRCMWAVERNTPSTAPLKWLHSSGILHWKAMCKYHETQNNTDTQEFYTPLASVEIVFSTKLAFNSHLPSQLHVVSTAEIFMHIDFIISAVSVLLAVGCTHSHMPSPRLLTAQPLSPPFHYSL